MKNPVLYLRNYRQIRKLTQKEMAEMLNMSQRNYSKIENGEISLTLDRLQAISKILNVPVEELLGYSVKPEKEDLGDGERAVYGEMLNRLDREILYLRELVNIISK